MKTNKILISAFFLSMVVTLSGCHTLHQMNKDEREKASAEERDLTLPPGWQKAPELKKTAITPPVKK